MVVGCKAKVAAKINIGLRVGQVRKDGYHPIYGIMQAISLFDCLDIRLLKDRRGISVHGQFDCPPQSTTVYKAAELFYRDTMLAPSVEIDVDKQIPAQGGLGGGSSDAAGTLIALNYLYGNILGEEQLLALARSIGADVSFFVEGGIAKEPFGTCLVGGIGDIVEPIQSRHDFGIVLIYPGYGISTKWAYENLDAFRRLKDWREETSKPSLKDTEGEFLGEIADWKFENSFQEMLMERFPLYEVLMEELKALGAEYVSITGSGSCVYGIFSSLEAAELAKARFLDGLNSRLGENTLQSMVLFAKRPLERTVYLE